nr:MAG TPA: hypothetical protein [Bacteriophage sp.]
MQIRDTIHIKMQFRLLNNHLFQISIFNLV